MFSLDVLFPLDGIKDSDYCLSWPRKSRGQMAGIDTQVIRQKIEESIRSSTQPGLARLYDGWQALASVKPSPHVALLRAHYHVGDVPVDMRDHITVEQGLLVRFQGHSNKALCGILIPTLVDLECRIGDSPEAKLAKLRIDLSGRHKATPLYATPTVTATWSVVKTVLERQLSDLASLSRALAVALIQHRDQLPQTIDLLRVTLDLTLVHAHSQETQTKNLSMSLDEFLAERESATALLDDNLSETTPSQERPQNPTTATTNSDDPATTEQKSRVVILREDRS